MDIYCANCGEPWDHWHLREDEIWETDLSQAQKGNFTGRLTPTYRKAFEQIGWQFGRSVYSVLRCPACEANGTLPDADYRREVRHALEDVLGDDTDGLMAELNDLEL